MQKVLKIDFRHRKYLKLTFITLSYCSRVVFSMLPNSRIPALLTKMSSRPNSAIVLSTIFFTLSSFVISAKKKHRQTFVRQGNSLSYYTGVSVSEQGSESCQKQIINTNCTGFWRYEYEKLKNLCRTSLASLEAEMKPLHSFWQHFFYPKGSVFEQGSRYAILFSDVTKITEIVYSKTVATLLHLPWTSRGFFWSPSTVHCSAVFWRFSKFRPVRDKVAPSLENRIAVAAPMPELAPEEEIFKVFWKKYYCTIGKASVGCA